MTRKLLFILLLFILKSNLSFSQKNITISGYIQDAETGEDLIGATVYEKKSKTGVASNPYGFYSLNLPFSSDSITLIFSYIGYEEYPKKLLIDKDLTLNIELKAIASELSEIVIKAETLQEKVDATQMSMDKLSIDEIRAIPAIFGEIDIIKAFQLKPGIQSGGEGQSGLYVRGGGGDQNLILLDEAMVYNASHLFGLFSVFNPDAVKDVTLYKGDFPAQYGGRLSSVLDVKLNEGNKKEFSGSGGLGLISSRLMLEGPILKDKSSFMVAGRRTYFDLITKQINKANEDSENYDPIPDYFFYDLNTKVNYEINDKNRLFLSGYFGRDVFKFNDEDFDFNFKWGNATTTLRWNHVFSPKLFLNTSLIFSDYKYDIENNISSFTFNLGSRITDYNAKFDFDYALNEKHYINFGAHYTYHQLQVARTKFESDDQDVDFQSGTNLEGSEFGIYINDEYELNALWKFNAGIRVSGFEQKGQWFYGIEPRFSVRYKTSQISAVKLSFAQMYQYMHLVSNSGASLPTDFWYPSNQVLNPQLSQQIAAGYNILLWEGKFYLSNEVYYKRMNNQVDLRDGAQIFFNDNLNAEFVQGRGWSYGNEIYLEKKEGKTRGWIGYTYSRTERVFGESNGNAPINNGNPFFPKYDRRHDISLVISHQLNKKWSISGTFVYGTGNAVSLPTGRFLFQNVSEGNSLVGTEYLERNGFRMPAYHRMDISLIRNFKNKWGESNLTISIYNAYNRRNAYLIYFKEKKQGLRVVNRYDAKMIALFPIIPAITYNFKF